MLREYRFLLLSTAVGLLACLAFITFLDVKPSDARMAATAAATQAEPAGDPARGQYLVQIAGCVGCHGAFKLASDKGVPLAGGNEFKLGQLGTVYSANLTMLQAWGFEEFDKALRQGIEPYSGRTLAPAMPYRIFHAMSDADIASIGEYLKSLTPVKNDIPAPQFGPGMTSLKPLPAESIPAPKMDDSANYGRYLVEAVANCALCHSPRDSSGVVKGRDYAGGTQNRGTQDSPLYAPPILGSALSAEGYNVENFIATLHLGIRPRGAPLAPAMPWRRFANMTNNDLTAIWNFLQTKKLDSPWPVQTAPPPPTAVATQPKPASTPASTPKS